MGDIFEYNVSNLSDMHKKINNIDVITIQKMIFIYNAILNGYTVKKLRNEKFEFKKSKKKMNNSYLLETFLQNFVLYNLRINLIR